MTAIKGRGAISGNASTRFNLPAREEDGDWLDSAEAIDGPVRHPATTVTEEHPRSILSFNASPDIPFDRSVNAYRGCEHGCIYCYARPSHAWHDLSPGLDFETKLFAKPGAAKILRQTLGKPAYRPAPIAMGTNTDPYQPIEGRYRITRQVLELCLETRHPVTITTKSDRVLRDIGLLAELARYNLVCVDISVTSLDAHLSRLLEPRAAAPAKRIAALGRLVQAGVPAHVSVAPIIPAITDSFLEGILAEAARKGVRGATWIMIRLPHEVAPLFREWLETHFPDRAGKVMATIQSIRGGRDNDPQFFTRMKPDGVWADLIRRRFRVATRRLGMGAPDAALDCTQFRKPSLDGQLSLL
ncbi:PA0069 family radical SAM protein [Novosphingobium album (ex Hu et al. 2023)]|uniref:PA0069 family radical SAM protein n=1 Tax=Novosphingobium album (ex Hu et al. 2023) TaxID=2930093 RepID=A0ABT0AW78_9SPHN|nr:PA0069 family radical SAM protein [Novosphingobium album (ex Hu et al. 2023)]MCJ2177083.1 PA0069 family radical SAM protein [Novosphingobium album (ex Hu et al. 2023)]